MSETYDERKGIESSIMHARERINSQHVPAELISMRETPRAILILAEAVLHLAGAVRAKR